MNLDDAERIEGTAMEPLLSKETAEIIATLPSVTATEGTLTTSSSSFPSDQEQGEENVDDADECAPSGILLGLCTLTIVLVGLSLVIFVTFLPIWIYWVASAFISLRYWRGFSIVGLINLFHLRALWVSARYLQVMRILMLPIRRPLLPLVPFVSRIESIREKETTQYYHVSTSSNTPEFRKSVRRHYRRMEKIYQRNRICHECLLAESSLVLRDVVPILWAHQQRTMDQRLPVEDFIKRFLVVTVVPDGVLDLYYRKSTTTQQEELVCVQFSILQGNVWHWFMYFCKEGASQAGIWWHGARLAIQRGHLLNEVEWVNAQMHQLDSKLHAGYVTAHHSEHEILSKLYPLSLTRRIGGEALSVRLWDRANADISSSVPA